MFSFEKFATYREAKAFHSSILDLLSTPNMIDQFSSRQLYRASLSVPLNIAEGSSQFTDRSQRNYYVIARGSLTECVAIVQILKDRRVISSKTYDEVYSQAQGLSKVIYTIIRNLEKNNQKV